MPTVMVPTAALLTQTQIARKYDLTPRTVARRLERANVPLHRSPFDHRVRLVRLEDVKCVFEVMPLTIQEA